MGYLDEAQHKIVSDAVAAAESTTSGEIVTVLADRSDGYTDIALWWAIGASFTAMSIFAAFPEFFLGWLDWLAGGWTVEWTQGQVLTLVLALGLVKFFGVLRRSWPTNPSQSGSMPKSGVKPWPICWPKSAATASRTDWQPACATWVWSWQSISPGTNSTRTSCPTGLSKSDRGCSRSRCT